MFEEALPTSVAFAGVTHDVDASPFPAEEALVANAVEKRRREFLTARACARKALAQLGVPAQPILVGTFGAPRWPDGIVGSITHCQGYRACAVARSHSLSSLGIDAEPNEPLPEGIVEDIALPAEREMLARLTGASDLLHWDRLLFSAKEAVYKVWFPLTGQRLGFDGAVIDIHPTGGTFQAHILAPAVSGTAYAGGLNGCWRSARGLLFTAICTAASGGLNP